MKLPETGCYSIVSGSQRAMIHSMLESKVNGEENKYTSEVTTLEILSDLLLPLKECCDDNRDLCGLTFDLGYVESLLGAKGYLEFKPNKSLEVDNFENAEPEIFLEYEIFETTYAPVNFTAELADFVSSVGGESTTYLKYDFSDGFLSTFDAPEIVLNTVYKEHVIIIKISEDEYRVFYKFSTTLTGTGSWNGGAIVGDGVGSRAVVPAALWLLKRAAMASIEALAEVGIYWGLEKWASNCPWGTAWDQLELSYWSLLATFTEGFIGGNAIGYLRAVLEPLVKYLFTGQTNRASGLEWDIAGDMIKRGFKDAAVQAAFGKVLKGLGKVTSKAGRKGISDEVKELVAEGKIINFCEDLVKIDINKFYKFVDKPDLVKSWRVLSGSIYSTNINALEYLDEILLKAKVGMASTTNYLTTWRAKFPSLQGGGFNVHHAIEQQTLNRWPGLFDELEINSLQNLRGISGEINPDVHLSRIRKEWDKFYNIYPPGATPTRQEVLDYVTHIDDLLGQYFSPPVRKLN